MTQSISSRQLELIEAAGKILTTSGVGGLTIKNLAKEMKFTEGAVYRHFRSKEEVIFAMLNYLTDSMDSLLRDALQGVDGAEKRFKALFISRFEYFKKYPHFVVAVFSDGLLHKSDNINEAISKLMAVTGSYLKPIVENGQATGVFTSSLSSEELVHISMGTFRLHMLKWKFSGFETDFLHQGDTLLNALLNLIKT